MSDFLPVAGFAADPYEDYSQPWRHAQGIARWLLGDQRANRPASLYRNFFTPDRNDVIAGFRTCAL